MFLQSMFIDFNSFFASCEQADRPALRGKPVVVVPLLAETTCCIAASREAKPFGIKTGTPVREARRLCPGLQVIEARPEPYIQYQKALNEVIVDCGVDPHPESIDEVHCPLWGEWIEEDSARALAQRIKVALAERVSPVLTCSIGIAPNKFLAKTASDMQKPDGLVVIRAEDLPEILHPLQLRDLCGIGSNMEARLHAHAIDSVALLCAASRGRLHDIWGSVEGHFYHDALHGLEPEARRPTEQRTLGQSHILPPELRTEHGARSVLHRLAQKAAMRLRRAGRVTGRMSVFVKYIGDQANWSDEIRFNPTQDVLELLRALEILWVRRRMGRKAMPLAVARQPAGTERGRLLRAVALRAGAGPASARAAGSGGIISTSKKVRTPCTSPGRTEPWPTRRCGSPSTVSPTPRPSGDPPPDCPRDRRRVSCFVALPP